MSRDLPRSPNLDHLKKQAKVLLDELRRLAPTAKLADAQRVIARQYGFESWPRLKAHVERRKMAGFFLKTVDQAAKSAAPGQEPRRVKVFDRYTRAARETLFFARWEAVQQGSASIETEHILLGLIRADAQPSRQVIERFGLSGPKIRAEIQARIPTRSGAEGLIPLSPDSRRVLDHASREADRMGHADIDAHHLLLGLLHEAGSIAGSVLKGNGMAPDAVRETLDEILKQQGGG
jgi:hypothetical protein